MSECPRAQMMCRRRGQRCGLKITLEGIRLVEKSSGEKRKKREGASIRRCKSGIAEGWSKLFFPDAG